MKNLTTIFAAVALSTLSFVSNASNEDKNEKTVNSSNHSASFSMGMYQANNTSKINLIIEKQVANQLEITLKNEKGDLLADEFVTKKENGHRFQFDMSALPDGKYTFEIRVGKEKIIKNITLNSQETTTTRTINF